MQHLSALRAASTPGYVNMQGSSPGIGSVSSSGGGSRGGRLCKPTCPILPNETVVASRGDVPIAGGLEALDAVLSRELSARAAMLPTRFLGDARLTYRLLLALSGESRASACMDGGPRRLKSLSTGMIATFFALSFCKSQVKLYGFGGGRKDGDASYQYFDYRKSANAVDHSWENEGKVLRFLKRMGRVIACTNEKECAKPSSTVALSSSPPTALSTTSMPMVLVSPAVEERLLSNDVPPFRSQQIRSRQIPIQQHANLAYEGGNGVRDDSTV